MSRAAPARSAEAYLSARARLGIKFGLETTQALSRALGHPERSYATLLVAGTNGKGSVVAYADAVLRASGLRVGRYVSPHLVRVNERITVGGSEIEPRALDHVVGRVREAAEGLVRAGTIRDHPTYFETLTVAAFEHFKRQGVETAVLEVGMGGRLDATNIVEPLASAIVTVERDHEEYLGSTLAAIAREKAGVLRPWRSTVVGPLAPDAARAVAEEAQLIGARLVAADAGCEIREAEDGLLIHTPNGTYRGVRPLAGAHQRANLLVAIRLLEEAREAGIAVDLATIPAGIARTRWPGRLEWVPGKPPLLLDGAHNPAGARALAEHLGGVGPFVLLFGALEDKDVESLTAALFPLAREIVLTQPRVERAATPEAIAARAGGLATAAYKEADPRRALALARRTARAGEPVVVAGSLYLVGEISRLLRRRRK